MKELMQPMDDKELLSQYEVVIVRPGGNDTAFVRGDFDQATRKLLNDAVMRIYPNVEQVGFILGDDEFEMAGLEFCGNATRAFAWLKLGGKPGELTIKTSGVSQALKAGVDFDRRAFVQIPVNQDKKVVKQIDETMDLVELEGITHLVVKVGAPLSIAMQTEDIKAFAVYMLDKLKLRESVPAAGVMFISDYEGGLYLEPVVWVKSIQTLFYETACGSGTAATGLSLSRERNIDSEVKVTQPSGLPIWVKTNSQFTNIAGPIQTI